MKFNQITQSSPHGLLRFGLRLPILLYKAHLGWVLGDRFLMLTHIGRKSGKPHQVVLEVVRHDRVMDIYFVASGWETRSNWFRNVTANPKIFIQIGNKRTSAFSERLSPEAGGKELVDYAHRHPIAFRELVRFMGYRLDGTEDGIRALGQMIPMFMFKTISECE